MKAKESDMSKRVGKHLQMLRKAAGFKSAKAFAEHIGYSPSAYTEYEQGRRMFTYEQAWDFADALDCTLDAVGGREPPARVYDDPLQESLNASFESMNEEGRKEAARVVRHISDSTELRISKERQDGDDKAEVG